MAIHELDEAHLGRFSFRSRDGVLEVDRILFVSFMKKYLQSSSLPV